MYKLVKRLKASKTTMHSLLLQQGNLQKNVTSLRGTLDALQAEIDNDPTNRGLLEKEAACLIDFRNAQLDEERFLKQKSKVEWLSVGDSNSAYFHNSVKSRNHRSRIEAIRDTKGLFHEGRAAIQAFVTHYENFLGQEGVPTSNLFTAKLSSHSANQMVANVTDEEIKKAMFSIGENKALGPDGYSSAFFKAAWDVVGSDVCLAVHEFFKNGKLLQQVNHMLLALVPKVTTPSSVTDFRPISCCNNIFKCISKILTDRMKEGLKEIVGINQSAFVPGCRISDNILLAHDLMHNYHRMTCPPRCAFKIDIQKAYDTVDWNFLEATLHGLGFHWRMIKWIMVCVKTASFSLAINGNVYGHFRGKRGLRQGDPMSPYLFTLVMEVLTLILHQNVLSNASFRFHNKCEKERIINICFADDLFLFARGEKNSAMTILKALTSFQDMSGLTPSMPKSQAFFCNVPDHVKQAIITEMPFEEGKLPMRYLGVPLISTRLLHNDCKILMEKMESRIHDWRNKNLSFAGRLQLIRSVLASFHIYWASVFILPASVIKDLEKKMRAFLWCQGEMVKGKAKVSWNSICLPKSEGGLDIRRLADVNKALMVYHIWCILTHRESLWVRWIHSNRLKGRSFGEVPIPQNCSWGWRKILQLREEIRPFVVTKIGNGKLTSVWFDCWSTNYPLCRVISPRQIKQVGFSLNSKVSDLFQAGNWMWPSAWLDLYPVLNNIQPLTLQQDRTDYMTWKDADGNEHPYSSILVWESLRISQAKVEWEKAIWYSQCIPRHVLLMWLIVKKKLKTQDKLVQWRKDYNLYCCPLRKKGPDSHSHLFFECSYATQVWKKTAMLAEFPTLSNNWGEIMQWLTTKASSRSAKNVIGRLIVAATAYFIWQERNQRLFSIKTRPPDQTVDLIATTIRLKLVTLKFKHTAAVDRLLTDWKVPRDLVVYTR